MSSRPFSDEEYAAIISRLAAESRLRDRLLVTLGCATGFRITELLSLTVGQVRDGQDVAREVTVARRHLKGGRGAYCRAVRGRRVPLAEPARAAIRDFLTTLGLNPPPERHLFTTSAAETARSTARRRTASWSASRRPAASTRRGSPLTPSEKPSWRGSGAPPDATSSRRSVLSDTRARSPPPGTWRPTSMNSTTWSAASPRKQRLPPARRRDVAGISLHGPGLRASAGAAPYPPR